MMRGLCAGLCVGTLWGGEGGEGSAMGAYASGVAPN